MAKVRAFEVKDAKNLREICLATSSFPTETQKQKNFLYYLYNDYYTEFEPESCFVLADDNDEAVGYILCAKDFDTYSENFDKFYMPRIVQLGMKYHFMAWMEIFIHRIAKKKYPAHLHIDIMPEYQGKGYGRKLISALKAHLKEQGIPYVMLSVGANNKGVIAFYKKNGFTVARNFLGNKIMISETD